MFVVRAIPAFEPEPWCQMSSVMLLILRTIADELPAGRSPPSFTVDHVIARVWDRNWKALVSSGFTPDDLRAIAVAAWDYAKEAGWSNIRGLFREETAGTVPMPAAVARAGILDLPSGRWLWIAPEHDGFIHVSLQQIEGSTERMEGAVREADFSIAEVERIAREPSIRWWRDVVNDVTWEIRAVLRHLPRAERELSFFHATLGTRSVAIGEDLRLGELSDDALRALLSRAKEPRLDLPAEGNGMSVSA